MTGWRNCGRRSFAFDTEDYQPRLYAGGGRRDIFSTEPGMAAYVPVAHDYSGVPGQLRGIILKLSRCFESPISRNWGRTSKYDMSVLARYGIEMDGIAYDTMLESYVLDSTATRHDMDSLARKVPQSRHHQIRRRCGQGCQAAAF